MLRRVCPCVFALVLFTGGDAVAVCGDVTGDGAKTATDALAVLRSSVGDPIELICAGEGPSDLRFYNDFSCSSGSSLSQARFNGFSFSADAGESSPYQSVDLTAISEIEIDLCGETFYFSGPINLSPGRALTFLMALLDPVVYQFPGIEMPAMFALYDEGVPAGSPTAVAGTINGSEATVLYGGRMAR
jgi:hypothetical protein